MSSELRLHSPRAPPEEKRKTGGMVSPLIVGVLLVAACVFGIIVLSRLLLPRLLSFVVRSIACERAGRLPL